MTPQERQLVAELFERLATLEGNKRDPQAEALISEGTRRAPNALYALVQTVLVQDEALRSADERIRELEGGGAGAPGQGGFLDNMRDTFMGRRGSVPSVGAGRDCALARARAGAAPAAGACPVIRRRIVSRDSRGIRRGRDRRCAAIEFVPRHARRRRPAAGNARSRRWTEAHLGAAAMPPTAIWRAKPA